MSITVKAVSELERVALAALLAHGTNPKNAGPVARAIALAEAEGNSVCGLFYLPIFCEHLRCGKVDGTATAIVDVDGPIVRVDAAFGFAHPAIAAALYPWSQPLRVSALLPCRYATPIIAWRWVTMCGRSPIADLSAYACQMRRHRCLRRERESGCLGPIPLLLLSPRSLENLFWSIKA